MRRMEGIRSMSFPYVTFDNGEGGALYEVTRIFALEIVECAGFAVEFSCAGC
jgi:hypothetical protein